jgi:hypothetical protein
MLKGFKRMVSGYSQWRVCIVTAMNFLLWQRPNLFCDSDEFSIVPLLNFVSWQRWNLYCDSDEICIVTAMKFVFWQRWNLYCDSDEICILTAMNFCCDGDKRFEVGQRCNKELWTDMRRVTTAQGVISLTRDGSDAKCCLWELRAAW